MSEPAPTPADPAELAEAERKRQRRAFDAVVAVLLGRGDVEPAQSSEFYRYVVREVLTAAEYYDLRAELSRLRRIEAAARAGSVTREGMWFTRNTDLAAALAAEVQEGDRDVRD